MNTSVPSASRYCLRRHVLFLRRCAPADGAFVQVEIDHFVPLHSYLWRLTTADPNAWANLQPLCPNCHAAKSQQERMRMPTGSTVPCACGSLHSTYFMPGCSAMREQVLMIRMIVGPRHRGTFR